MFTTTAGLWLAVVLSGLYHGLNPGMGWPLAVSSALMEQRGGALPRALAALGAGHFLAMLVVLLPFAAMTMLVSFEREIRLVGGTIVVALGLWLLLTRRHPRFLSRIPPGQLTLWSFCIALVHGAALMLVPIYLGLCAVDQLDAGHRAASDLMTRSALTTLAVAAAHTLGMLAAGGTLAFAMYRWYGLGLLRKTWFDTETIWAASLILVGGLGLVSAL